MKSQVTTLFPGLEEKDRTTGVLPSQEINKLITGGCISAGAQISDDQIQPASIDLRLGAVAYRVRASFLPGKNATVSSSIEGLRMHEIDLSRPAVSEKGCVYIVPLVEELRLPRKISGRANPKSTTGRLDIFTRLITDYSTEFERVRAGYTGKMYVEIVPRAFSILVREGTKLNQLRFVRGGPLPSKAMLDELQENEPLVYAENDEPGEAIISEKGLWISIDLQGTGGSEIVGYKTRRNAPLVDLSKVDYYDPLEFWEPIRRPKTKHIILNPDDFYILLSKEKVRVRPDCAAEMVPYDPSVGEFRIHYAGFFDPGFGYGDGEITGTHAVLEVRSHEVPFVLEDGQVVGRLIYERLLSVPEKIYGTNIGSSYQCQGLSLSKQFKRL
ncbi:MAG: 2'-deoxycytidine 5'-triphosphate deaminase [Thermodesulfobacteriota bacterium]